MPQVQDVEGDRWLGALAGFEGCARVEGSGSKLENALTLLIRNRINRYTYSIWASASAVDQLNDGVRIVFETDGEDSIGGCVAVGGDEALEVVGDLGSLIICHTWWCGIVARVDRRVTRNDGVSWGGERDNGEKAGSNSERTHFCRRVGLTGFREEFLVLDWYMCSE